LEKTIPGIAVTPRTKVWKLICSLGDATVKIEVNGTKRGIIGNTVDMPLCAKAKEEFCMGCKARTVSFSQLYGGKITAALSRQHPRDLFDCKYMDITSFANVKDGFIFSLLGSDRPIIESLLPNEIDQTDALEKQFEGMSDVAFSYEDYRDTRAQLIKMIQEGLTSEDKKFLLSFEKGTPDWNICCAGDLSNYPSIQWKLLNVRNLKDNNPQKYAEGIKKLQDFLF